MGVMKRQATARIFSSPRGVVSIGKTRSRGGGSIVITGDKEIDAALAAFEPKFRNQVARKASRSTAKKVEKQFKQLAPVDTGAMRDSTKVKALKRSRVRMGHSVILDRQKLFQLAEARGKKLPKDKRRGGEPFFYPAVVEFGASGQPAAKPLRDALFGSREENVRFFRNEMLKELGIMNLRESARRSGATLFRDASGRFQRVAGGFASRAEVAAAGLQ